MINLTTWIIIISTWLTLGETGNCFYPRLEDDYDSEGFICKWEEDDFYFINEQYILAPEDSTDNCFEEKARKRYWKNK